MSNPQGQQQGATLPTPAPQQLSQQQIDDMINALTINATRPMGGGGRVPINPPDKFSGDREKVDTFIWQCKNFVDASPSLTTNKEKIVAITTYIREGVAEDWVRTVTNGY